MTGRRARAWSTSCSSTASQSSMASIYARMNQSSPLAEPTEGHTNVYGSFTTTVPATPWLRTHLTLDIPVPGIRRAKQRDLDYSYESPPDSPLLFFPSVSGSRRSPSISRTLLSDLDWAGPSTGSVASPPPSSPTSPLSDDDNPTRLHPVLLAVEKGSKLSCSSICSTCMKVGTNFPRCPRCDETWCSRACRLQGGKKHSCAIRK
ncbi:hypothetical protein OG21DRAFT_1514524, partial [Imleria badia]